MKTVSIKLDNYVLDLVNKESRCRKITRMELIRSAIINFLLIENDSEDLAYIRDHKDDKLVGYDEVFG